MGVKERKEREKAQRSNNILEAARSIFESKGFLNTTLQDVAQEAEISVGLIYRYFQSKEDIFASLALKGAEKFDSDLNAVLKKHRSSRKKSAVSEVLYQIVLLFFDFYGPYGEYFDMLHYSYKGMKKIQIHSSTLTRLMSITLNSIDKLTRFIVESPDFRAQEEDDALRVVFILWATLLGCHKLFDNSGRGQLFAFNRDEFIRQMIEQVLNGISTGASTHELQLPKLKVALADKRPH